jgi:cold-inducible RNA-binding protein
LTSDRYVSRATGLFANGAPSLIFSVLLGVPIMGNKLYVGNLPYTVRDEDLQQSFSEFGSVNSAKVMMERDTGRSKGFGFVEMGSDAEAQAAIEGMNGQSLGGRSLVVNEARPMEARPPRTGGFGGPRGGGGGFGGGAGGEGGFRSPYGGGGRRDGGGGGGRGGY